VTLGSDPEGLRVYIDCMQSAKLRLRLVERVVSGELAIVDDSTDGEFACLQVRKCLELIAFSSIAAHKGTYSKAYADFANHWRAKRLLEYLKKVHPDFYPTPVLIERESDKKVKLSTILNEYLTQEDFVLLYDSCSKALHEANPYKEGGLVIQLHRPMSEWVARIRRLLAWHVVRLVGTTDVWIVQLDGDDGLAHGFPAVSAP
jgi:hypothetical protein